MTRDEIIAILRDMHTEWLPGSENDTLEGLWEWQADALLAAMERERLIGLDLEALRGLREIRESVARAAQSDEATIADLKERGVLTRHPTWVRTKDGALIPDEINEPHWIVVLPGPAMEDEQ